MPVVEGTLRAPWRWERLLVEAAVIGSQDRWRRRLDGLGKELASKRAELEEDDPQAQLIQRQLLDLQHLRAVALPHIEVLDRLPRRAKWSAWLEHLRMLAEIAIRDREPVLAAFAALEPMGPVGPVSLDEVRLVLGNWLGELAPAPPRRRYGAVYVAPPAAARGLSFDLVFVPGLSEKIFPKKTVEDPILRDSHRAGLGGGLVTQSDRVETERLALHLVIGAARRRVVVSYPRIDIDQGRPRVPSFYALEILRAAEGKLPAFEELRKRAAGTGDLRLGWPAPESAQDAIDEAEFDLSSLVHLLDADPLTTVGTANYLLGANEHLARALRARARRWLRRWTPADGLVEPDHLAREALAAHQTFAARSYSVTALQNFADDRRTGAPRQCAQFRERFLCVELWNARFGGFSDDLRNLRAARCSRGFPRSLCLRGHSSSPAAARSHVQADQKCPFSVVVRADIRVQTCALRSEGRTAVLLGT